MIPIINSLTLQTLANNPGPGTTSQTIQFGNLLNVALPKDNNSAPIQLLTPEDSSVVVYSVSGVNNNKTLPNGATVIEIAASDLVQWSFGVSASTASSRLLPGTIGVYVVPNGATSLSIICASGVTSAIATVTRLY